MTKTNWIGFYTFLKREFLRFFKVPHTTIFPVLVTVAFYMIVFGIALGTRIQEVAGVPYLLFIVPGLYMQMIIQGSYSNPSGSLFVARQWGSIHDILMSPISHTQMIFAYVLSGMARGFFLGLGTLIIALLFLQFPIYHGVILVVYSLLVAFVFALSGIIIGLWAKRWEQLNIFINFVITPLTFLGGIFYTLDMVPRPVATITQWNPIYYMVDGTRYAMIGVSETNIYLGLIFLAIASMLLFWWVWILIRKGYNLKV